MADLSGISLTRMGTGRATACAAAFRLSRAAAISSVFHDNGSLEIETKAGVAWLVVRFADTKTEYEFLDAAIEEANRALDKLALLENDALVLDEPLDQHVLMFMRDILVIRYVFTLDVRVVTSVSVTVTDAEGKIVPPPPRPELPWSPALRYYRLARLATDVFEGYRDAYLAFESLLSAISPRQKREHEKVWLHRVLDLVAAAGGLSGFDTPGRSLVEAILEDQYEAIRVKLFHAKEGISLLPQSPGAYTKVAFAYAQLLSLWEEIARWWLKIARPASIMTYAGFRETFGERTNELRIAVTADLAPPAAADTQVSPNGKPIASLAQTRYVGEVKPGILELIASSRIDALPVGQLLGRLAAIDSNGVPIYISLIEGGLTLDDIGIFEVALRQRLVNVGEAPPF